MTVLATLLIVAGVNASAYSPPGGPTYTTPAPWGTDADRVAGFATFGDFRAWPGYRYTVEHSVHVAEAHRGRGIGTALMRILLERGAACGKHVMVAGIDADNRGSIRMHERLGFVQTGHLEEVGWKFGRWLDLVFMQRRL